MAGRPPAVDLSLPPAPHLGVQCCKWGDLGEWEVMGEGQGWG